MRDRRPTEQNTRNNEVIRSHLGPHQYVGCSLETASSVVMMTVLRIALVWWCANLSVHGSTLNYLTGNRFQLSVRNAMQSDIKQIATLCSDVFEGPFDWYQVMDQKKAERGYYDQLNERYRLVTDGYKHAMIVACEKTEQEEEVIRGFIEIGTLPSPVLETQEILGTTQQVRPERPYFGNVVVDAAVRRQGVGAKLVRIGVKLVESKWKDECVFVAVDSRNDAAISMYEKLEFTVAMDESMMINRRKGPPRVFYVRQWGGRLAAANGSDGGNDNDKGSSDGSDNGVDMNTIDEDVQ